MIPYEVGYMYLRDEDNHPRVTIAYMHVELDEHGTSRLWYGVACQNVEHDRWERAVGRNKASGRLNSIAEAKKCPKLYDTHDRVAMTRQEAQSTIVEHILEEGSARLMLSGLEPRQERMLAMRRMAIKYSNQLTVLAFKKEKAKATQILP